MKRVAINGLGRIGRALLKNILSIKGMSLVAINDIIEADKLALKLMNDKSYGCFNGSIEYTDDSFTVNGHKIDALNISDPALLPWKEMNVDCVFECTGVCEDKENVLKHFEAGAKYVLLVEPSNTDDLFTIYKGKSNDNGEAEIIKTEHCSIHAITPIIEIIGNEIGIKKGIMTGLHAYTQTMNREEGLHGRDSRAVWNFVPTESSIATLTTRQLPQYKGKFGAIAVLGPVPVGSLADFVLLTERNTTKKEINEIFTKAAKEEKYREVVMVSDKPLISFDILRNIHTVIIDITMTTVVDGDLVKIMSWYDNEWGFAYQMAQKVNELIN